MAWKAYGTHVTGYDMADISSSWAAEGVGGNINFKMGNLCVLHSKLLQVANTQSLMVFLNHVVSKKASRLTTILLIWSGCRVLRCVSPWTPGVIYFEKSVVSWWRMGGWSSSMIRYSFLIARSHR